MGSSGEPGAAAGRPDWTDPEAWVIGCYAVNEGHVEVLREAFAAVRSQERERLANALETGSEHSLDAAWADAEATLPEGWSIGGLTYQMDDDPAIPNDWLAYAGSTDGHCRSCQCEPSVGASGPTPAAALQALAARLRDQP